MNIEEHPTVKRVRAIARVHAGNGKDRIDAAWLRQLALDCGADDAGLVEIDRPALDPPRGTRFCVTILGRRHCWASPSV